MKILSTIFTTGFTLTTIAMLSACESGPTMQSCNFLQIENVDVERGQVQMFCSGIIVDVTWAQFREKLRIDPVKYKNNLTAFKREVICIRDERSSKKELLCKSSGSDGFVTLNFTDD